MFVVGVDRVDLRIPKEGAILVVPAEEAAAQIGDGGVGGRGGVFLYALGKDGTAVADGAVEDEVFVF